MPSRYYASKPEGQKGILGLFKNWEVMGLKMVCKVCDGMLDGFFHGEYA